MQTKETGYSEKSD